MPNGDNWQGDVLRDLRAGAARRATPQEDPEGPAPGTAATPGAPGTAAGARAPQAQHPATDDAQAQARLTQAAQERQAQAQAHVPPQVPPAQAHVPPQVPPAQAPAPPAPAQAPPAPAQAQPPAPQQPHVAQPTPAHPQPTPAHPQPTQPAQHAYAQHQAAPATRTTAAAPATRTTAATPATRTTHATPTTPDSRPVVDKGLAAAGRKPRHGEGFATRAARVLRRTVSSSAAREVAETTRTAETLQQPVTTGRQIAVTSIRGGAGKSTVAALLGLTYAHYRQDPVLLVEADPALGSLPLRLGAETLRWTTGDVAGIVEPQMSLLDITGYLVQLPDNAWLLPGSQGQIGAMLDTRAYERVMVALRRYFGVTVVDCETLPAEVARVALSAAQARVLTAPATLEGITSTYAVLQWMQGLPRHVIAGTVVVLTELVPHTGLDVGKAAEKLASTGASVQVLPYDRHLAAGGPIRTELLAQPTRQAATRLAADVFHLSQKRH
ncbi:MinD/ParA family ATP-binding protein [Streptomyces sp. WAC05374]|uniref:MinD/ParA family ATP-binding protein n=1 Tax=Streptomyces sp. WAC05374 TaxID=2487420 RepID=UPI00190FAFA6|nr:MinD/ParA family protein [Streptomyces sp. WAC05374]